MRIDVYCTRPRKMNILSRLIMFLSGTKYSHMAIGFKSATGNNMVIDCSSKTCKTIGFTEFYKHNHVEAFKILNADIDLLDFQSFYEPLLGTKYDYKSIIGLMLKYVGLTSYNTIGRDKERLICSELVLLMLARFFEVDFEDSDNYGLIEVEGLINDIY